MDDIALTSAVPPGAWAVGVSGGADSVALLWLLRRRLDLRLRAAHLDHQTRDGQSADDARFVQDLCAAWEVPCVTARRDQIESGLRHIEENLPARYRAARLAFFKQVVAERGLGGVVLGHHGDDQAETVLQRLCRGAGPAGLIAMRPDVTVAGLRILRPLLDVGGASLRDLLRGISQSWREDITNASPRYLRNRLRALLCGRPELALALRELAGACDRLDRWTRANAPVLEERFSAALLADSPSLLADAAARRWLLERGAARQDIGPAVAQRLCAMAGDAATPAQQHFPGPVLVRRRQGVIFAEPPV